MVIPNDWPESELHAILRLIDTNSAGLRKLDVAHALLQFLQLFLQIGMLLGHLLVLAFPFVPGLLKGLDFTLIVTGLDISLSEPTQY